jgi:transposase
MGARESAETRAGLALIEQGHSVRKAAKAVGVAPSTLQRAKDRKTEAARKAAAKLAKEPKT